MLGSYLIGLREGLEATLLIAILLNTNKNLKQNNTTKPIWYAITLATLTSITFGAILTFGTHTLTFKTQETIEGTLSIITALLMAYTIIFFTKKPKNLNKKSIQYLTLIAFLAVGREGIETTLFLWSTITISQQTLIPLTSLILGITTAIIAGIIINKSSKKTSPQKFFTYSNYMLTIIAAGIFTYGIHDLQEAAIIPGINRIAYDISNIIPTHTTFGTILQGTLNYNPQPSYTELIGWWIFITPTTLYLIRKTKKHIKYVSPK